MSERVEEFDVTTGPPDGWTEIYSPAGMSNSDHSIDEGFEDALKAGGVWGRYAAWEFNGTVWWDGGQFRCQVWRYHAPVAHFTAPTLERLMGAVSDEYGSE